MTQEQRDWYVTINASGILMGNDTKAKCLAYYLDYVQEVGVMKGFPSAQEAVETYNAAEALPFEEKMQLLAAITAQVLTFK